MSETEPTLPDLYLVDQEHIELLSYRGQAVVPVPQRLRSSVDRVSSWLRMRERWVERDGLRVVGQSGHGPAVVTWHHEFAQVGHLVAHLTGRRFVHSTGPAAVAGADLYLVKPDDLLGDLLNELYPIAAAKDAPGILCAGAPESMLDQAIIKWLHACRPMRFQGPVAAIHVSGFPLAREDLPEGVLLSGGEVDERSFRELVGADAAVLGLSMHSDGVDGYINPILTFCAQSQIRRGSNSGSGPRCIATGRCHRAGLDVRRLVSGHRPAAEDLMTVEDAHQSRFLVDTDALRARFVILWGCWGIIEGRSFIDSSFSLALGMFGNALVATVATTWKPVWADVASLFGAINAATAGRRASAVVGQINLHGRRHGMANSMLLLGYPEARLDRVAPLSLLLAAPPPTEPAAGNLGAAPLGPARLLAAIVRRECHTDPREIASANDLAAAVEAGETDLWPYFTAFLREHGPDLHGGWMSMCDDLRFDPTPARCDTCAQTADVARGTPFALAEHSRTLQICSRCGIGRDAPATEEGLRLFPIRKGRLRLIGRLDGWRALLIIESKLESERRCAVWPTRSGTLCRSTRIGGLPPGAVDVVVVLLKGDSWASLRIRLNGEHYARPTAGDPVVANRSVSSISSA